MVTFLVLGLVALVALGYWIRKRMKSSSGKKRQDGVRREAAARLLEQDRLDCLELEKSLKGRMSSVDEPAAPKPAPSRRA